MLTDIRIRLFLAFTFYSWDQRTGSWSVLLGQMKAGLSIMIVVRKKIRKRVPRTPVRYIQNSGWLKNFPSFRSPIWLFLGFSKLIKNWIKNFGSKILDQKIRIKKFGSKNLDQKFGNLGSVVPWTYQGIVSSVFLLPTLPSVYCIPPLLQHS